MRLWFGIGVMFLLVACSTTPSVVCNEPYMLVGTACCLDSDSNAICDRDEGVVVEGNGSCPELDCSLCPATIIEKNVTVSKTLYVCDKTQETVDDPAECAGNKEHNAFENYNPYTGAEERGGIELFDLRPACRDSEQAIEIHFRTELEARNLSIEIKQTPSDEWESAGAYKALGTVEDYIYGVFCEMRCTPNAGFFLAPNTVHLMRAKIVYNDAPEPVYSNEYIVDSREDSDYMTKLC